MKFEFSEIIGLYTEVNENGWMDTSIRIFSHYIL